MTTISTKGAGYTMINVFEPPEGSMARLEGLLVATSEAFAVAAEGFVSANLHVSKDGKRLVNYAQWASEDAFRQVMRSELGQNWFGQINAICEPSVMACDVVYVSGEHAA